MCPGRRAGIEADVPPPVPVAVNRAEEVPEEGERAGGREEVALRKGRGDADARREGEAGESGSESCSCLFSLCRVRCP